MSRLHFNHRAIALLIAAVVLGGASGSVFAVTLRTPAGVSSQPGGEVGRSEQPRYEVNEAGQTYGSLDDAVLPKDEPDLIRVQASNGMQGYVYKSTLDAVTGANVSSPEEALEWQKIQDDAVWTSQVIPVFESDGITQVGTFEITRSQPAPLGEEGD